MEKFYNRKSFNMEKFLHSDFVRLEKFFCFDCEEIEVWEESGLCDSCEQLEKAAGDMVDFSNHFGEL